MYPYSRNDYFAEFSLRTYYWGHGERSLVLFCFVFCIKLYFTLSLSIFLQEPESNQALWYLPVIPALGRQEDHEFKVSLVYTVSLRPAWATFGETLFQKAKEKELG
jgi:hypothetical protein